MSTWYKDGTASFANGSATVTGSGTSWVDNVKIGDALRGPDGRTYEIVELVSSAEIKISPAYEGSSESNSDYAIQPTRGILQRVFNQIQAWLDAVDDYLLPENNLSELTDVSAARDNLGLGTAATQGDDRYAHRANNLSDIVDAPTARDNLGLGTAATENDDRYVNVTNPQSVGGVKTFSDGIEADSYGGDGVTQSPTDTTSGRLTKVGDGGLLGSTSLIDDWDTFDKSQPSNMLYHTELSTSNNPWETPMLLLALHRRADRVGFLGLRTSSFPNAQIGYYDGDTTQVETVYHTGNLVGTVSQSGGDPTGAVIERDSNSNGEYVRFADGTQICFMQRTTPLDELTFSFTYPADFIGTAQGTLASWASLNSAQRDVVASHYTRVMGGSAGSTMGEIVFPNNASEVSSGDVFLVSFGRWF